MDEMQTIAKEELSACRLCPRACGVDRLAGGLGVCRAGAKPKVFRWGAHFGEEPPVSGTRGSGAVFFSHCPLGCLYCQNHPWTAGGAGEQIPVERLAGILRELAAQGCHNWNLVTPEPWLPLIREAGRLAREEGADLPFVYNTSGYVPVEVAARYRDLMDVALADLRYASAACAREGSRAPDYPEVARAYVRWCWENVGPLELDGEGVARRGTIVRLLVLPGHADEAVENLRWLHRNCGTGIALSLMSQYTPAHAALRAPPWDRTIAEEEFLRVTDEAARLGMEEGWTQPWGTAVGDDELMGENMPPGAGAVGRAGAGRSRAPGREEFV